MNIAYYYLLFSICYACLMSCEKHDNNERFIATKENTKDKSNKEEPQDAPLALPPAPMPIMEDLPPVIIKHGNNSQGAFRPARMGNDDNDKRDALCGFAGGNEPVADLISYILDTEVKKD